MYMSYYIWSGPGFFLHISFYVLHIFITKVQISCAADQHLCFCFMNSTIPLLPESHYFQPLGPKKKYVIVIYYILNIKFIFYYPSSFQSKEVI